MKKFAVIISLLFSMPLLAQSFDDDITSMMEQARKEMMRMQEQLHQQMMNGAGSSFTFHSSSSNSGNWEKTEDGLAFVLDNKKEDGLKYNISIERNVITVEQKTVSGNFMSSSTNSVSIPRGLDASKPIFKEEGDKIKIYFKRLKDDSVV